MQQVLEDADADAGCGATPAMPVARRRGGDADAAEAEAEGGAEGGAAAEGEAAMEGVVGEYAYAAAPAPEDAPGALGCSFARGQVRDCAAQQSQSRCWATLHGLGWLGGCAALRLPSASPRHVPCPITLSPRPSRADDYDDGGFDGGDDGGYYSADEGEEQPDLPAGGAAAAAEGGTAQQVGRLGGSREGVLCQAP